MRSKAISHVLLKENIGEYLHHLGTQSTNKGKVNTLKHTLKFKIFVHQKISFREGKDKP